MPSIITPRFCLDPSFGKPQISSYPVIQIAIGLPGVSRTDYLRYSDKQTGVIDLGTAFSNLASAEVAPQPTNITKPSSIFKRVLPMITRYLLVNSTLHNVTVPYFFLDAFAWIKNLDGPLLAPAVRVKYARTRTNGAILSTTDTTSLTHYNPNSPHDPPAISRRRRVWTMSDFHSTSELSSST